MDQPVNVPILTADQCVSQAGCDVSSLHAHQRLHQERQWLGGGSSGALPMKGPPPAPDLPLPGHQATVACPTRDTPVRQCNNKLSIAGGSVQTTLPLRFRSVMLVEPDQSPHPAFIRKTHHAPKSTEPDVTASGTLGSPSPCHPDIMV